jgi:hypothetical protein
MSIQGFLSDRSLIDSASRFVNLEKLAIPCGYLDRDTIEFFIQPTELGDLRASRLPILFRQEAIAEIDDTLIFLDTITNVYQKGLAHLLIEPSETVTLAQYPDLDNLDFINDSLPEGYVSISNTREIKFTLDYAKLSDDEKSALETISSLEQQRVFNVIEYLSYGTIASDSLSDINSVLVNDPTNFLGYVTNSIKVSSAKSVVMVYGGVNIHRLVPGYFSFKFIINSVVVEFKIWFNKSLFKSEYPESTIINIVPPLDLQTLLNPSGLTDPINSAILSKKWSDSLLQPELTNRDQTGMYLFETRYIYNGNTYMAVFSLIYRGRCPDSLEARNAIAEYLLNSGVGSRAIWEIILPDIFYHSAFLLIPFYDNITKLTNADIYPSIIKGTDLIEKINTVTELIARATDPYREIMTAAYEKYFVGVAPADTNLYSSLLTIHPTYRDFSTTDNGWSEMTSNTREWSVKLNQALSVAAGETNILTFAKIESGGLNWVNFVYDHVSYLVLDINSYLELFTTEE